MDTGTLANVGEVMFDEAGDIVRPVDAAVTIERHADGRRTEVQDLRGSAMWSMDRLHGVSFGTHGAAAARTTFDAHGVPVETAFLDAGAGVLSRLRYLCDGSGAIREVVQYAGEKVPCWADRFLDAAPVRAHVEAGHEQARAVFDYDDAGRLMSTRAHFFGQVVLDERRAYNERRRRRHRTSKCSTSCDR